MWVDRLYARVRLRTLRLRKRSQTRDANDSSPSQVQKTNPVTDGSDYDEVNAILEPYWHIWNLCLEQFEVPIIDRIKFAHPPSHHPDLPTIISLHLSKDRAGESKYTTGENAYPPWLNLPLQAGIAKFNTCDATICMFYSHLKNALEDVDATVDWLTPTLKPRLVFHYSTRDPVPIIRHSVFGIRSRNGNGFVADFTIEQFGFKSATWFQKAEEYLSKCTLDGRLRMKADMSEMTEMMDAVMRERVGMNRVIWELCDGLETVKWKGLDGHTKMEWLKGLVEEACRREFEDEIGERKALAWANKW
jgi:hypothetical protein